MEAMEESIREMVEIAFGRSQLAKSEDPNFWCKIGFHKWDAQHQRTRRIGDRCTVWPQTRDEIAMDGTIVNWPDIVKECINCGKEKRIRVYGEIIPSLSVYIPDHHFDCICGKGNDWHYAKRKEYRDRNIQMLSDMARGKVKLDFDELFEE